MLLIMLQNMMKHGTEQRGGKMQAFIILLFTVLLTLAMNSGDWVAYLITIVGFMIVFYYSEDMQ